MGVADTVAHEVIKAHADRVPIIIRTDLCDIAARITYINMYVPALLSLFGMQARHV